MKQRSISAIGIVLLSVIPALIGGPLFAVGFAVLMMLAFRELIPIVGIGQRTTRLYGYASIGLAALIALFVPDGRYLPAVLAIVALAPLIAIVFRESAVIVAHDWSSAIGTVMYMLLPTFAAISLRQTEGSVDRTWFQDIADAMPGSADTAEGLGWFLLALLVTWLSDTAAYLVGRTVGRTKLIPRVSPNKTVEGAIGGLVASGLTAALCAVLIGLPLHPLTATLLGLILGAAGILGDLSESQLKRRAGVKDSSDLIPGHGGVLDRVDALIFVLVATWAVQPLFT